MSETTRCYYYDEQRNRCNCYVNENLDELLAENAKLREFVYDMWNDMNVYYTQHESPDSSDMDFYYDNMRELGMEVLTRRYSND